MLGLHPSQHMGMSAPLSTKRRFKLFAAGVCVFVLLVWLFWELGEKGIAPMGKSNSISQIEAADIDIICDNTEGILERDVCYWDRFIEEWRLDGIRNEGYCYQMDNSYMQYVCLRYGLRPHMMPFVSLSDMSATLIEIPEAVEGCRMQEGHLRRFCIMGYVASLASSNLGEAQRICTTLGDPPSMGECTFYIAVARAMNLASVNIDEEIAAFMELCNSISDADWRAECYFVLADELALLRPVTNLSKIVEACRKSMEAANFGCYNHAVMLLPSEDGIAYCSLLEEYEMRYDCALGAGRAIADQSGGNITWGILGCQKFSPPLAEPCLSGMALNIGDHYSINISHGSIVCRDFPVELVEPCIHGVSRAHAVLPYNANVSPAIQKCKEFPPEFQGFCFDVLIGDHQGSSEAVAWCGDLPPRFTEKCLERLQPEEGKE